MMTHHLGPPLGGESESVSMSILQIPGGMYGTSIYLEYVYYTNIKNIIQWRRRRIYSSPEVQVRTEKSQQHMPVVFD